MSANVRIQETELIDAAVGWLGQVLPQGWSAERSSPQYVGGGAQPFIPDAMVNISSPQGGQDLLVEARESFSPRDAERLMSGLAQTLRGISRTEVLLVTRWLSARTRQLLRDQAVNYLDLTGNAYIKTAHPAIFIQTDGATQNPTPAERERARLRGPKAARLIRLLLDVRPPYTVGELAQATGLTPGYVSRLLSTLDYEALVQRSRTGAVISVAVEPLLRRWVETYDVMKSNEPSRFVAAAGPEAALRRLRALGSTTDAVLTGSFAAAFRTPVAMPALLMVYTDDVVTVRDALELLPSAGSTNVVLLRPYDAVVYDRTELVEGVKFAADAQVAADCLTGSGRMPEEGEALLEWMNGTDSWQPGLLADLTSAKTAARDGN